VKINLDSARPRGLQPAPDVEHPIVIAIDGTSASGKSTNARLVARALGYVYVDTGAMYRTLAWHCLKENIDVHDHKAVASACRRWKTKLDCVEDELRHVRLLVGGYYPEKEIRTNATSAAVPHVAAVPKVREWMKKTQRQCIQFGSLVMEGRDIGTNVFPETDFKFYLDANLEERARRRQAEGVTEDLAARDQRDSQRAAAPLMIPLGAVVVNNSGLSAEQTSAQILDIIRQRLKEREDRREVTRHKPRWQ
jgi:cytidylate kinase